MGAITENGVPHVVEVRHLNEIKENSVLKLARVSYNAALAHYDRAAYVCACSYLRTRSDDGRADDSSAWSDGSALVYPDVFRGTIVVIHRQGLAKSKYKLLYKRQCLPGILAGVKQGSCKRVRCVVKLACL